MKPLGHPLFRDNGRAIDEDAPDSELLDLAGEVSVAEILSFRLPDGERDVGQRLALHRLLVSRRVEVRREVVPELSADCFDIDGALLPEIERFVERFQGPSMDHKWLCAQAAIWLREKGVPWTVPRRSVDHADLVAVDRSLAVKCGAVTAASLLESLAKGMAVAVVPHAPDVGLPREVAFVFSAPDPKGLQEGTLS